MFTFLHTKNHWQQNHNKEITILHTFQSTMTKVENVLNKLHNQDATIVFRFRSAICYKYKDIREHLTNSTNTTPCVTRKVLTNSTT